tara:strand:+ start:332 stop:652 length:321 start_codon:yes stop_codon:yes gene_type:complete
MKNKLSRLICAMCGEYFHGSPYRSKRCCSTECYKDLVLSRKVKMVSKCKYCGKDCKLTYCSKQCAKKRTKILLDISNRKKQQKQNPRVYTQEELDKFQKIKEYLCK